MSPSFIRSPKKAQSSKIRAGQVPSSPSYTLTMYEWVFVLMSALIPLHAYNFQVMGLRISADRSLLGLLILFFPFYSKRRGEPWGTASTLLATLGVISLFLSTVTGGGMDEGALNAIPGLLQSLVIFGIGAYVFKNNSRSLKIIAYIFSAWAVIFAVFSGYTLYYYYVLRTNIVPFPFLGYISDFDLHKFQMMMGQRLFMPLASAPHLGAITGAMALWGLTIYLISRRWLFLLGSALMLCICFLTLSRGPILAFLISLVVLFGLGNFLRIVRVDRRILMAGFALLSIGVVYYYYRTLQLEATGRITADRLMIDFEGLKYGRHLALRLYAINMFAQGDLMQMLMGQGLGAIIDTGIGAYSFVSYFTLLVETGIFGSLIFSLIYFVPLAKCWHASKALRDRRQWYFFIFSLGFYLAIEHLFYELKGIRGIWLQAAYVFGSSVSRVSTVNESLNWLNKFSKRT